MTSTLAPRFFRALGVAEPTENELARIEALLRAALDARPRLDASTYVDHVAMTCAGDAAAIDALELGDLAFALACARGDRDAVQELETTWIEAVPKSLTRLRPDARFVEEVKQQLREKLLVGSRPKLLEYKGRGPLGAWVRVVALRLAYELLREANRDARVETDEEALATFASEGDAPDVAHLRAKYAAEFREAFCEAARKLSPEERAVLRSHAVDGLTIDQIGALYQVHRATAARWVNQARASLLAAIRETLSVRLHIERAACDSIVALVQSRIDLSLERALGDDVNR